jgi:hypothetical protein
MAQQGRYHDGHSCQGTDLWSEVEPGVQHGLHVFNKQSRRALRRALRSTTNTPPSVLCPRPLETRAASSCRAKSVHSSHHCETLLAWYMALRAPIVATSPAGMNFPVLLARWPMPPARSTEVVRANMCPFLFFPYTIGADRHQMRATTANEAHTRMAGELTCWMSTPEPMKSAPAARPPTSEGIDRFLTNAKVPPAACGDRLSQSS